MTKTYDDLGNVLTVTDEENRTTTYAYDAANELTSVTDALNEVTQYGYDLSGNKTSQIDANGHNATDPTGMIFSVAGKLSLMRWRLGPLHSLRSIVPMRSVLRPPPRPSLLKKSQTNNIRNGLHFARLPRETRVLIGVPSGGLANFAEETRMPSVGKRFYVSGLIWFCGLGTSADYRGPNRE